MSPSFWLCFFSNVINTSIQQPGTKNVNDEAFDMESPDQEENDACSRDIQHDEILALQSIFGDDVIAMCDDGEEYHVRVVFPRIGASPSMEIRLVFPETYPQSSPPIVEIQSMVLDTSTVQMMVRQLEESMFVPGQEVCFEWLTWVGEQFEQLCGTGIDDRVVESTRKVEIDGTNHDNGDDVVQREVSGREDVPEWEIFHGDVSEQKKSRFQGHVARVSSVHDVERAIECLLVNNKIQHATHNMMAYRMYVDINGTKTLLQDCDDDGEAAAGKRLLHLLQVMDVDGLLVVVSRWYGGVHLGPARFQCINNAARTAIEGFRKTSCTDGLKIDTKQKKKNMKKNSR